MLLWLLLSVIGAYLFYLIFKQHYHFVKRKVPHIKPWPIVGNMGKFVMGQQTMADWISEIYNSHNTRIKEMYEKYYERGQSKSCLLTCECSAETNFCLNDKSLCHTLMSTWRDCICQLYVGFHTFVKPVLMVKDPELIKKICVKNFDHFVDHQDILTEEVEPIFGKSLFMLKGQKWRHMRATLSPAFTGSKMRTMFLLMTETVEQFVNYFSKEIGPNETKTLEMKDTFTRFANDVIATTAFGIKCDSFGEKENAFYMTGKEATTFTGFRALLFFGYSSFPKLMKLLGLQLFNDKIKNFFRNIVVSTIAMREKERIIRPDMIHLLMEARKGKLKYEETADQDAGFATVEESQVGKIIPNDALELDDDTVTGQAFLFFLAGFDGIATIMCHMAYELTLNEDAQRKLQKEIDETMEKCKGKLTYEILVRMKYLDMVSSETLRKWGAPQVDRKCGENFTIEPENSNEVPIEIQKGDVIWIPIYAIHRDPKYYPNPNRFDPERFSDENKGNIDLSTYLPFGVGPRNCIGSRFALLEIKIMFFYLLSKFNLVVVQKTQIPLQISKLELSLNAQNGFWIGLKHR